MPLSEYKDTREEVQFTGGSLSVRAVGLPDLALLIGIHEDIISNVVDMVRNNQQAFANGDSSAIEQAMVALITDLARESPMLVANIIAICADEPDQIANASRLPLVVQMDALAKIAKLTFTDMAAVKKLAADVMSIVNGLLPLETTRAAN